MRKVLFIMMLWVNLVISAQNEVTKFLGIPIDGYKPEMIKKLEAKGFVYNETYDYLDGEFNGTPVHVYVVTNNNKVWRIMIADKNQKGETDIRIRFNNLCNQFLNNDKYIPTCDNPIISDEEDLQYEILVNDKRYEASFAQTASMDTIAIFQAVKEKLLQKYTEEDLSNPNDDIKKEIILETYLKMLDDSQNRSVWFMISELYGKFYITMFYDNKKNKSNGEDL